MAVLLAALAAVGSTRAAEPAWTEIPVSQWQGRTRCEVQPLKTNCAVTIAYPAKAATPLVCTAAGAMPPGLYEVRLTFRPSHTAGWIPFHSGLRIKTDGRVQPFPGAGNAVQEQDFPEAGSNQDQVAYAGRYFARPHQAETRSFRFAHEKQAPLTLTVAAFADPEECEKALVANQLKGAGPGTAMDELAGGDKARDDSLDNFGLTLDPGRYVYVVLDKVELRRLCNSGTVTGLEIDKIRYTPGATLKGSATLAGLGGAGCEGTLNLYLEHDVATRVQMTNLPVKLAARPQAVAFEMPLPKEELGYALVVEFVPAVGEGASEMKEFFNIASNFNRVAQFGLGSDLLFDENLSLLEPKLRKARSEYCNACECFAWAEDDMVGMAPESDYWFSGQTRYHMCKKTMQEGIRIAHENGIAMVSYAKFQMSGYLGWKTAFEYPSDHRTQYLYPVGMWEGVNVLNLDRFRNQEFVAHDSLPGLRGNVFSLSWSGDLFISPDPTPHMTRVAADSIMKSAAMFGWDGIRWDGHMRGGGPCGGDTRGKYDPLASRQTQTLVRYLKDTVSTRYPDFGYGYNYLTVQDNPSYDWAYEDFELDELCRGGGLLMNESLRNWSSGRTVENMARNLQVEGDLCRERGGYFLGIGFARTPRDSEIEAALWSAAGARPYGGSTLAARRYCTRYSQYTFDETLRRLASPEKVLSPRADTKLWWQPFVYEACSPAGKRQLVVNLLNLPQSLRLPWRLSKPKPEWDMLPGTDPVAITLTLPAGMRATGAHLIDPYTLEIRPLALDKNGFEAPAVAIWAVAVIDLEADAGAPTLGSLFGPPRTFGVPRPSYKGERKGAVILDPTREIVEVNKDMKALSPPSSGESAGAQAALDALPWDERNAAVLKIRDSHPPESTITNWWKGGSLPADLALKDKPRNFGDLAPHRNGRFDIYQARGAMDYVLRLPRAFAGLDRFFVQDAPLQGTLQMTPNMHLGGGVPWNRYPEFDLVLFTGVPHCALGAENAYALVEYVKAGGAALFTGGEYAFGKGGYSGTVLDRELLPVTAVEEIDTRYAENALVLEPGKDFAELGARLDFSVKPSFWVWNQVALKSAPGIKVFLKSGNRPILVGWQLGKGRVACLLLDNRGKSENGSIAFFLTGRTGPR